LSCHAIIQEVLKETLIVPGPIERIRRNSLSLVLAALVASLFGARSASATVLNLEQLANASSSLLYQYTFEGANDTIRETEKKAGVLNLQKVAYGTASTSLIQYNQGFDSTSTAVFTARPGGDVASVTDNGGLGGTGLSTGTAKVVLGNADLRRRVSVEVLMRPSQSTLTGNNGGLGHVVFMREKTNQRAYFLYQGSGAAASADDFSAYAGEPFFAAGNQLTITPTLQPNHWYYYATTFDVLGSGPLVNTEIRSYLADLTAGQTTLTALGPITANGIFTNAGSEAGPLGIGITALNDTGGGTYQSAFPGGIDAVALYTGVLSQATFQSHLDALWLQPPSPAPIPEPSSLALMFCGLAGLALRRRKRRAE
jgi:hypothetical protein